MLQASYLLAVLLRPLQDAAHKTRQAGSTDLHVDELPKHHQGCACAQQPKWLQRQAAGIVCLAHCCISWWWLIVLLFLWPYCLLLLLSLPGCHWRSLFVCAITKSVRRY
jgi:hypothetical protein